MLSSLIAGGHPGRLDCRLVMHAGVLSDQQGGLFAVICAD